MRQFEQMGLLVEEVARVIGMPLDEAQAHVEKLGLRRVRTTYMLMDRVQAISTWWPTMASSP